MGRYIDSGQIVSLMPALISTSALTPGQIEFFIETVEDEIDGRVEALGQTLADDGAQQPGQRDDAHAVAPQHAGSVVLATQLDAQAHAAVQAACGAANVEGAVATNAAPR